MRPVYFISKFVFVDDLLGFRFEPTKKGRMRMAWFSLAIPEHCNGLTYWHFADSAKAA